MTPEDRALAAMEEARGGPLLAVTPARTEAIVAEAIRAAVVEEREACALAAEQEGRDEWLGGGAVQVTQAIAAAIRARET